MTSEEINNAVNGPEEGYRNDWLKEIAYQLAVMNEQRHDLPSGHWLEPLVSVNESLASPVHAGSDTEVRGGHQEAAIPAGFAPYCRFCRLNKSYWVKHPECLANPNGRTANERTMRSDPQSASIQTQTPNSELWDKIKGKD